jgi:hypothetical protein
MRPSFSILLFVLRLELTHRYPSPCFGWSLGRMAPGANRISPFRSAFSSLWLFVIVHKGNSSDRLNKSSCLLKDVAHIPEYGSPETPRYDHQFTK